MGSNDLKFWELHSGGSDGTQFLDAGISTAAVTDLQSDYIEVRRAAAFTALSVTSVLTGTAIDYLTTAVPTGTLAGVTMSVGTKIFAGYGRYFNSIQISTGQVSYINIRND